MAQVMWAPAALADVEAIAQYIARDSADNAALFVTRLMEATDRLARFPESGRILPEIGNAACREVVVAPYRIMYRLEADQVWITGIVHGARNWRPE